VARISPSVIARAGRSAMKSSTPMRLPMTLQNAADAGASCCHSASPPHSSPSMWLKPIQRRDAGSIRVATASRTWGNSRLWPVWNSSGCSSRTRN
jgi:hypothetical protein